MGKAAIFGERKFMAHHPDCMCGKRYGQHRYGDLACPNPQWRCGNGKPQWLVGGYVPVRQEVEKARVKQ